MTAYRQFVGSDGRTWLAWLADPERNREEWAAVREGQVPEPWLCFGGGRKVHRLRPVPDNWSELDDQALRELSRVAAGGSAETPQPARAISES